MIPDTEPPGQCRESAQAASRVRRRMTSGSLADLEATRLDLEATRRDLKPTWPDDDDKNMLTSLRDGLTVRRERRRAGGRARRKYAELRQSWLRRNRKLWLMAAVLSAAIWLGFWWLMRVLPGDQSWASAAFGGALAATLYSFRQQPPVAIATWEEGAFGEEQTGKQLRALEKSGWIVLHDLANGSKNFDHVVLGPNGIFCLNSKWSGYRLDVDADGKLIGRHQYDDDLYRDVQGALRQVRAEAATLRHRIHERCGTKLWVQPVIVWWGEVVNGGRLVDGVGVVQGMNLVPRLKEQRGQRITNFDEVVAALRPGRHARGRSV